MNREINPPLRLAVLEITNRCNLRCSHCASASGLPRDNELTVSEWQHILGQIRDLGGEEITLIGGELFLNPEWILIAEAVKKLGMRLVLISNGLLIRDNEMAQLQALRPSVVGISIDGATAENYLLCRGADGFQHVLTLLHRLVTDGHVNVNAITTFTRSNIREFDLFRDLFKGTAITWQVQIANSGGARFHREEFITLDDYRYLVDKIRDTIINHPSLRLRPMDDFGYFPIDPALRFLHQTWDGCIAGRSLIGIRSNGDLLGCLSLGNDFIEGNLREKSLPELWRSENSFSTLRHKGSLLAGICAACPYGRECRAGCTGIAYSATGEIGCNPYCIRALETEDILAELAPG